MSVIEVVPALVIYLSPFDADKFIVYITSQVLLFILIILNSYRLKDRTIYTRKKNDKISRIKENHYNYLFSIKYIYIYIEGGKRQRKSVKEAASCCQSTNRRRSVGDAICLG